jgi:hypothetical protein
VRQLEQHTASWQRHLEQQLGERWLERKWRRLGQQLLGRVVVKRVLQRLI